MNTNSDATPVFGHGTNNLDNGIDLSEAAQSDVFLKLAGEMYGEEEEEIEERPVEDEVIEEDEESDEDGEIEEEESEEESDEEEDQPAEEEEETIYIVTVDNEELEVSEEELLSGYQRQRDYTKKTQELAEERKKVQGYVSQLEEQRNHYKAVLDDLIKDESKSLDKYKDVDWADLRAKDPQQFLLLQYEMQEAHRTLQTKLDARAKVLEQVGAERDVETAQMLEREGKRVAELVDGWNGENSQQLRISLREQSIKEGFIEEDETLLQHAMVIKLLQKAKAYDDLQEKKETVVKKKLERKAPKVVKTGAKETQINKEENKKKLAAREKLRRSGNINDSYAVFADFV